MQRAKNFHTRLGVHFKLTVVREQDEEIEAALMKNVLYSSDIGGVMNAM